MPIKADDITIAVCCPLTGRAGRLGKEMQNAVQLAAEGRVKVKSFDDKGVPMIAQKNAFDIVNDNTIYGVVGHYGSDTTLAASRVYHAVGLPIVIPVASNPMITESGLDNVFRYTNRDDQTGEAIAGYLFSTLHKRSAVIVKTATPYGNSMSAQFKKAFKRLGGSIPETYSIDEGTVDFTPVIRQLTGDFDMVFYGGTFEGAPLLKALRKAGFHQLLATGDGCWDMLNFIRPGSPQLEDGEGVLVLSASSNTGQVQASREVVRKYELQYGPIGNYALNCYDAACLLIRSIEAAMALPGQTISPQSVLRSLQQIDYTGVANPYPVHWDEKGDNVNAFTQLNIVQEGKFKEVSRIPKTKSGSHVFHKQI